MRVFLFLFLLLPLNSQARVVEKVVAIVNDQIITLSDIETYRKKVGGGGLVDDALLALFEPQKLTKDRQALIDYIIDEKIIDSEVKRKNLAVTIERVEQELRTISGRNGISRQQLKQALKDKGVVFSDYQDFVKTSLERQALIEKEISSKIKISDDDVSAYFISRNGKSDLQIFEFTLSHMLFLPSNGGPAAAQQRAEAAKEKLSSASFEKLAEQYSEDPNFSSGGLLGTFKAGEMVKEIEAAVKNLSVGETTDVVKTRLGFHLIKVTKKALVADPRLEKEREEIRARLYSEAFKKQFRHWLDQMRETSFIRIN